MKKLLLLIVVLAAPLSAQDRRKAMEQFHQQDGRPCVRWNDASVSCLQGNPQGVAEIRDGEIRPAGRAVTRGFWLATGAMVATMVLDVESTRYALRRGLQEGNPLYGNHPSVGRLYGIGMGLTGVAIAGAYYLKSRPNKHGFRDRWWLAPVIVHNAEHGLLALHNYRAAWGKPVKTGPAGATIPQFAPGRVP